MEELGIIFDDDYTIIYTDTLYAMELFDFTSWETAFSKRERCINNYKEIAPGEFVVWVE